MRPSRGWPALHAELAQVDPATAARLAPNDSQRIGRALEIFQLTGTPMSALLDQAQSTLPYRVLQLALIPSDRAVLHQRIAERFDAMLAAGLLDEVESLRRTYALNADLPAMRAVGYRQAWAYLEGELDIHALREQGIAATRQLAKRQLTWLRSWPDAVTLDCLASDLEAQAFARVERSSHSVLHEWVRQLMKYRNSSPPWRVPARDGSGCRCAPPHGALRHPAPPSRFPAGRCCSRAPAPLPD